MGAGYQERTSRALWVSRRVGHSGRSNPEDGQTEGPGTDDEVPRRTCLECAVEGTIEGQGTKRGYEGEPEGDRMGEGLPSVLRSKGKFGKMRVEETTKQRGGNLGTSRGNGLEIGSPPFHEGGVGYLEAVGWDTLFGLELPG
jgi:hypothetical protein